MKKVTVFLSTIFAIAIVAVSFSSCGEEPGIYEPKKKISKVYEQKEGRDEYLVQDWLWNGNKLASITYYYRGEFDGKDEYTYEGDRIVKIEDNWEYYAEFYYLNKKFDKIKYYKPNNSLSVEITFQYDGKKVSVITFRNYDWDKNVISMISRSMMDYLLPEEGIKMIVEKLTNQADKFTLVLDLSYKGDNLSLISLDNEPIYIFEDYDNNYNVFYNFFPFSTYYEDIYINIYSKNNPRKVTNEYYGEVTTFTYTYDGKFPITIEADTEGDLLKTRIVYQ
ncbi:MAG TPA: hypothetical protein PLH70_01230 [Bacteroidales bacterium]|nr:hypothetical protein [Bacteroidales bacterium]HPZ02691.1 hypothetical protein [Bacteroidales bacterium]HQB74409.1 hypothetical protein [Bacteroidales bacterium]